MLFSAGNAFAPLKSGGLALIKGLSLVASAEPTAFDMQRADTWVCFYTSFDGLLLRRDHNSNGKSDLQRRL